MSSIFFFAFILLGSYLFAKVEIAIEGSKGWAEGLPTWKLSRAHWVSRILFGGRPATGYHAWMITLLFLLTHTPHLFQSFSLVAELRMLSFFILLLLVEDFLWFILNPAFGLKNFKAEKIWWHKENWWLVAPREYFIFLPIGIGLYILSAYL